MKALAPLALSLWAGTAAAHPHVFIDANIGLVFDADGRLAAVRVLWSYDEFYSLIQIEELELDKDGDGELTDAENAELAGFDTNWVEGFEGDIYLTVNGVPVALDGPVEPGAQMVDGRIATWHLRPLAQRLDPVAQPVVIKVYDPGFYTAYTVDADVGITGRPGCAVEVLPADLNTAYDKVEEFLYGSGSTDVQDDEFPEVGEYFADTLTLTCAPRS